MGKHLSRLRLMALAAMAASLATLGFAGGASAHTGAYARFNYCPSTTSGVFKCVQAVTSGGEVVLGNKKVPIVNPVTVQGGLSEGYREGKEFFEHFYGATNGESLSKTPQPVPGGLAGLVNCKEISNFIVRIGCEAVFENGLTGVNATLELAKPASEIIVSESNLARRKGIAFKLPVKVHLENPFLGSSCYVGSSGSPIMWNLTTGTTEPPPPNTPISGSSGQLEFIENEEIAQFEGVKLVDNAWSAPGASGCGGWGVELILNPIINAAVGVPAAAGKNTANLDNTRISLAEAEAVNAH